MKSLSKLQDWYARECDGDWEHTYGVKIQTLDNPGWMVDIDLADTDLAAVPFESINRGDSDEDRDWVACRVEKEVFRAAGGASNLTEILEVFLEWAAKHQK